MEIPNYNLDQKRGRKSHMFKIQSQQIEKLKPFQFKQYQNTKHHIIDQFLAYTYKYSTFTKMTHEGEGE